MKVVMSIDPKALPASILAALPAIGRQVYYAAQVMHVEFELETPPDPPAKKAVQKSAKT